MDADIRDMADKGLIEIVRQPRSEKLAELIRTTKAQTADFWVWYDWAKCNRN